MTTQTRWARLTWFKGQDDQKIHKDDRALFGEGEQGLLVVIIDSSWFWTTIEFKEVTARVSGTILTPCEAPKFSYGETVRTLPPRTERIGTILDIRWHFKTNTPFYYISISGERHKSKYAGNELSSIESNDS